jgi:hypothetical protein
MNERRLETESAMFEHVYNVRVQIPTHDVSAVLEAIVGVSSLNYGNYEQVAFRYNAGTQQIKPVEGS